MPNRYLFLKENHIKERDYKVHPWLPNNTLQNLNSEHRIMAGVVYF